MSPKMRRNWRENVSAQILSTKSKLFSENGPSALEPQNGPFHFVRQPMWTVPWNRGSRGGPRQFDGSRGLHGTPRHSSLVRVVVVGGRRAGFGRRSRLLASRGTRSRRARGNPRRTAGRKKVRSNMLYHLFKRLTIEQLTNERIKSIFWLIFHVIAYFLFCL